MADVPAPTDQNVDIPQLERNLRAPRTLLSAFLSAVVLTLAVLAMVPLFSVLYRLVTHGGRRLGLALFTELPPAAGMLGGGIGNALVGTIEIVALATLVSVPFGILAALFIGELAPDSKTASGVRFAAKVLTGYPSVLAGLFVYAAVVLTTGTFSALAGGLALALLMLPTVILTAEEAITMVPAKMREAAYGMGATRTQVIWHITLPTSFPGILTGVMLAVARAAGETAPLLFTAQFSNYWPALNPMRRTPSLAVLIYNFSGSPFDNQVEIAWAASLVLVALILALNITAQVWGRRHKTAR